MALPRSPYSRELGQSFRNAVTSLSPRNNNNSNNSNNNASLPISTLRSLYTDFDTGKTTLDVFRGQISALGIQETPEATRFLSNGGTNNFHTFLRTLKTGTPMELPQGTSSISYPLQPSSFILPPSSSSTTTAVALLAVSPYSARGSSSLPSSSSTATNAVAVVASRNGRFGAPSPAYSPSQNTSLVSNILQHGHMARLGMSGEVGVAAILGESSRNRSVYDGNNDNNYSNAHHHDEGEWNQRRGKQRQVLYRQDQFSESGVGALLQEEGQQGQGQQYTQAENGEGERYRNSAMYLSNSSNTTTMQTHERNNNNSHVGSSTSSSSSPSSASFMTSRDNVFANPAEDTTPSSSASSSASPSSSSSTTTTRISGSRRILSPQHAAWYGASPANTQLDIASVQQQRVLSGLSTHSSSSSSSSSYSPSSATVVDEKTAALLRPSRVALHPSRTQYADAPFALG